MSHFFFYGTLIPQFAPEYLRELLNSFHLIGEGWAYGTLYDLGAYPGAVFDATTSSKVFGRVFRTEDGERLLAALDRYEGYDPSSPEHSEYLRRRLPITLEDGAQIDCWVYQYNGSFAAASLVPSGRYEPRPSDN